MDVVVQEAVLPKPSFGLRQVNGEAVTGYDDVVATRLKCRQEVISLRIWEVFVMVLVLVDVVNRIEELLGGAVVFEEIPSSPVGRSRDIRADFP